MSFHPDGSPAALQSEPPERTPGKQEHDLDLPGWAARLVRQAFNEGRVRLDKGKVLLDGAKLPAFKQRSPYTYAQALSLIEGLALSADPEANANLREFLTDVLEVLAEHGKVRL